MTVATSITSIESQADAVAYLTELNYLGKLNGFTDSLLSQYERKGFLTSKQIASLQRGLQKATQPQAAADPMPTVAEGRYALCDADGTVDFFEVEVGKSGRWDGFVFLSQLSGDNHRPVKDRDRKRMVLNAIAADPKAAMVLYGKTSQHCAVCHHSLTDDENKGKDGLTSLQRGIGPVCAAKMGWM